MKTQPEETTSTEIIVPTDEKGVVEVVPFGTTDRIKLSAKIVRAMIAQPTKSGKLPDDVQCIKFIMLCKARHLNPFEGDAYMLGYDAQNGPQFSLITAHQVFLKRAEASEAYDGMESGVILRMPEGGIVEREGDFVDDGERLIGGWAKVYRKNTGRPIYRRLKLSTFNTSRSRWEKDPAGMIVKCAEADALRTSFPTHLGGLFIGEELSPIDVTDNSGKLQIKRARVPDSNGSGGGVAATEPGGSQAVTAKESPPSPSPTTDATKAVTDWEKFGDPKQPDSKPIESTPEPEKKTDKPLKKKKGSRSNEPATTTAPAPEIPPNQALMLSRLAAGGRTPADLARVAFANEWIEGDERWPYSEEKLAKFLSDQNWPTIQEELEALSK